MEVLVYDIETDGSVGNQSVMATVTIEMNSIDFPCDLPSGQSLHWHLSHWSVYQCVYWVCVSPNLLHTPLLFLQMVVVVVILVQVLYEHVFMCSYCD